MKTCRKCGQSNENNFKHCSQCGGSEFDVEAPPISTNKFARPPLLQEQKAESDENHVDLKFSCPICMQHIEVGSEHCGSTCTCPSCQKEITIPNPHHVSPIGPVASNKNRVKTAGILLGSILLICLVFGIIVKLASNTKSGGNTTVVQNGAVQTSGTSVPASPTALTASVSSGSIQLAWADNANNETGYKIERKTGEGGTWELYATVGSDVTSYTDTSVVNGSSYYYRVYAYNDTGFSPNYSNETGATLKSPEDILAEWFQHVLSDKKQELFDEFHPIGKAKNITVHDVSIVWKDNRPHDDFKNALEATVRFTIFWISPLHNDGFTKVEATFDNESQRFTSARILATNGTTTEQAGYILGNVIGAVIENNAQNQGN